MVYKYIEYLRSAFILHTKGALAYARYKGVKVGANCRIYTTHFGSEPFLIEIGDNVTVTSGVKFITHDGSGWLMRDDKGRRYLYQKISIGSNVFIGINCIIMPGVKIDDFVVIAPGSVITKSIPSGVIVGGVPAKIIGDFDSLKSKMINYYISDADINYNTDYYTRIIKILNKEHKPYLSK